MPKLLWVAMPLLAVAAWLCWGVLRRRVPSRLGLNVATSVLLLGYVATTAGLGIFWVANQQLPVFDWHYLFGYATVLLLVLHLAFNWRVVWRFLVRPPAPTASTPVAHPRRLGVFGAIGALAAVGAAYWAGWRSGQGQARVFEDGGAGIGVDPATLDGEAMRIVERFHAQSSNSRHGVLQRAPGIDWGDAPPSFKPSLPGALRIALPGAAKPGGAGFDLAALAKVLRHTAGITAVRGTLTLRASPSSGALFPAELYVAALRVPGLAAGLWHYDAQADALEQVDAGVAAAAQVAMAAAKPLPDAASIVVATAVFWRSGHKYRDRTYRYVLADLGHAIENLRVAARAVDARCTFALRFDEARCAAALQLDEAEEGVLAWLALVPLQSPAQFAPRASEAASAPAPPPRAVSRTAPALGITGAMHAATSLNVAPRVPSQNAPEPAPAADAIALAAAPAAQVDWLRVIWARRSVRRFSDSALEADRLSAVLAALAVRDDFPALSEALRISVVVNAVAGLEPGAYRYDARRHALEARRAGANLREAARAAALDQDVIGDAQVVFVLGADRAALLADPTGVLRGYRHALLQAGCLGECIYLAAGARGLAACSVGAFYDDEAAALIGADPAREWVLHFVALGAPA